MFFSLPNKRSPQGLTDMKPMSRSSIKMEILTYIDYITDTIPNLPAGILDVIPIPP